MIQQASNGSAVLGFIVIAIGIYLLGRFFRFLHYRFKYKKQAKAIKSLMLAMLRREIPLDQATSVIKHAYRSFPELMELLRSLQIITESIDIALSSANPKTAKSRMELVEKTYARVRQDDGHLLAPDEWQQIDAIVQGARSRFEIQYRINAARRLLEKAEGLKREASKQKYHQEAADLIRECLAMDGADNNDLQLVLQKIPTY